MFPEVSAHEVGRNVAAEDHRQQVNEQRFGNRRQRRVRIGQHRRRHSQRQSDVGRGQQRRPDFGRQVLIVAQEHAMGEQDEGRGGEEI